METTTNAEQELQLLSAELTVRDQAGNEFVVSIPHFDPKARAVITQSFERVPITARPELWVGPAVRTTLEARGRILPNDQSHLLTINRKEEFNERS